MGYLGSSLDDYYSYQLLDKVAEQIDSGDTGNIKKLQDSLNNVMTKIAAHNKRVKKRPKAKLAKRMSNNAMVETILSRFKIKASDMLVGVTVTAGRKTFGDPHFVVRRLLNSKEPPTPATNTQIMLPTKEEMWKHLRTIPVPPLEVLLGGGHMQYYVDAAYDYISQKLQEGA